MFSRRRTYNDNRFFCRNLPVFPVGKPDAEEAIFGFDFPAFRIDGGAIFRNREGVINEIIASKAALLN